MSQLIPVVLSEEELPRTHQCLREGLAEGVAPGFVAGYWMAKDPWQMGLIAVGNRRTVPTPLPMEPGTVFDLASLTKVMGTATLAAVLVDRGWLSWESPLSSIFPDYPYREIRIRHLLSHTAGLPAWAPFWEQLRAHFQGQELASVPISLRQLQARRLVFAVEPIAPPGQQALYSDVCFLLLGFALEEILQLPLAQAVERWVWEPMRLRTTRFRLVDRSVSDGIDDEIAATEDCPWRGGVLQGQVHDDNTWAMGGYAGHAGAFGSAEDVLRFASQLMTGFLSEPVLREMWSRVDEPKGCERTLGWDSPSGESPSSGRFFGARSVGHLGFTGTSLWIDPDAGLAVTLLSNRVHPTRENIKIRAFRPRFHDALRTDLGLT